MSRNTSPSIRAIVKLGDDFASRYQEKTGRPPSSDIAVHCKRKLMHAVWNHLMDHEFMDACTNGLPIRCADGNERVFFVRILTYSADYPEKILLATIKNLGRAPCPRCLIKMNEISGVGTQSDARLRRKLRIDDDRRRQKIEDARALMFRKGLAIRSDQVQRILGEHSMVPTRNAFSALGQEYHNFFVVDLLHEFEIGVWKSVLTHLIRILYASTDGDGLVAKLDARFHNTPTFGRDTIRRLPRSVSALSKLAARDYEDILQCSIPAFEGLFAHEEDNRSITDLLFTLSTWHAYAKLRLHTDSTLEMFENIGTALCQALRHFAGVTCPRYATKELPREATARAKRGTKAKKPASTTAKVKTFNMTTIKNHFIPDYPNSIRRFGTTDSYSTQTFELAHCLSKQRYRASNKNRNYISQVANKEARARFYVSMLEGLGLPSLESEKGPREGTSRLHPPTSSDSEAEDATKVDPKGRYCMPKSNGLGRNIAMWLSENRDDHALHDFRRRLLDHLLARVQGLPYTGDEQNFTDADRDRISIFDNQIHEHKTARFMSTTYDAHRISETANPRSHADIIVLSHEDDSEGQAFPYWHARIIGIYHVIIQLRNENGALLPDARRMDILFVRWFGLDSAQGHSGWHARRMHSVGFLPDTDALGPAFGFLDPNEVIRMVHLIPDFASGRTKELLSGPSMAIQPKARHPDGEYKLYYVAMFSDRDLFMRYRGGGVGHLGTRHCNGFLLADEHPPLGEITTYLVEPQDIASGSDGEGEDDDVLDGASDRDRDRDHEFDKLAQTGEWNDMEIITAAGLGAL